MATRSKALEAAALDVARGQIRAMIDRDFRGVVKTAAKSLGVAQSQLSDFLGKKKGLGLPTILAICDYMAVSVDELLGRGNWKSGAKPEATWPNLARAIAALRKDGRVVLPHVVELAAGSCGSARADLSQDAWEKLLAEHERLAGRVAEIVELDELKRVARTAH